MKNLLTRVINLFTGETEKERDYLLFVEKNLETQVETYKRVITLYKEMEQIYKKKEQGYKRRIEILEQQVAREDEKCLTQ